MRIVKPADLKIGDVVRFEHWYGPYGDHDVVREADGGFYLRRPYIDSDTKEAAYEEGFWLKDSDFKFQLVERES